MTHSDQFLSDQIKMAPVIKTDDDNLLLKVAELEGRKSRLYLVR
jgi:hypothetical protein